MESEQAYRTGRLAHMKRNVFVPIFNVDITPNQPCVFVEPGIIERLQSTMAPSAE
ncbi:hypothetical protein [Rhodanobacter lycopersici]|uniref:hypothetical protein n=1 Tax=Rhodanobacter lycopersici TaxID=3162487 RepID=UPI003F5BA9E8